MLNLHRPGGKVGASGNRMEWVHWGVAPWAAQPLPLGVRRALRISMQVRCHSSGRLVPIIPLWTLRKPAKELGFLSKRAPQPRGPCAVASPELDPRLNKGGTGPIGRTGDQPVKAATCLHVQGCNSHGPPKLLKTPPPNTEAEAYSSAKQTDVPFSRGAETSPTHQVGPGQGSPSDERAPR